MLALWYKIFAHVVDIVIKVIINGMIIAVNIVILPFFDKNIVFFKCFVFDIFCNSIIEASDHIILKRPLYHKNFNYYFTN
ncbi:hypothetical protein FXW31_02355 [Candidatus Liberibacter asiaticus]|nr:hypothetical protein FXW31_02355 [Candidatus Liberibacter asiaticus]